MTISARCVGLMDWLQSIVSALLIDLQKNWSFFAPLTVASSQHNERLTID